MFSDELLEEIENYYKLKREYIQKQNTSIAKITSNKGLTLADKRERVKELKNKCVKCKGSGGTIFEETSTRLHAVCNAEPKCDLNIDINKGEPVILLPELLNKIRLKLENEKVKLMEIKIKHALETISDDEALQMFEEKNEKFRRLTTASASLEEKLINITNNSQKSMDINRLKIELYNAIEEYKDNLKEFRNTGREEFMRDALEKYKDDVIGLASELRETDYVLNLVETDDSTGENQHKLIQEKYTLRELEVPLIPELRELLTE